MCVSRSDRPSVTWVLSVEFSESAADDSVGVVGVVSWRSLRRWYERKRVATRVYRSRVHWVLSSRQVHDVTVLVVELVIVVVVSCVEGDKELSAVTEFLEAVRYELPHEAGAGRAYPGSIA